MFFAEITEDLFDGSDGGRVGRESGGGIEGQWERMILFWGQNRNVQVMVELYPIWYNLFFCVLKIGYLKKLYLKKNKNYSLKNCSFKWLCQIGSTHSWIVVWKTFRMPFLNAYEIVLENLDSICILGRVRWSIAVIRKEFIVPLGASQKRKCTMTNMKGTQIINWKQKWRVHHSQTIHNGTLHEINYIL